MYCPKCGKQIKDESVFCMFCGGNVQDMITPTTPPPASLPSPESLANTVMNPERAQSRAVEQSRYQQMSLIGMGGMGHVYKAYDAMMEEWIALKTLPPQLIHDPKLLGLFIREARHTRRLAHPNIIRVHDVVELDRVNYITMEFVDGGDLKNYLLNNYPLKFELIGKFLYQICNALYYLHSHGIIHRDLKPQNILLDQNLQVKISDFGIAKALDETGATKSGSIIGTASYMSPEHLGRGRLDHRSDLYSLGVILYEMITRDVPFTAETPLAIGIKHLNDSPPSPRLLRPDTPVILEQAVLKCMAKAPEDRFQDAKELIDFLRKKTATGPAPPPPPPQPSPSPSPEAPVELEPPPLASAPEDDDELIETAEPDLIVNSLGMNLKQLPPGAFLMGSNSGPEHERPAHPVRITYPFYLSVHQVTQQQYQLLSGSNPSLFTGDQRPVENISWSEARRFCQLLSQREGVTYRLPSEAEWEYAARAGSRGDFPWGEYFSSSHATCAVNSSYSTEDVGRLQPNRWGIYDLAGNVWEWCEDVYAPYSGDAQTNPLGPRSGPGRVVRGGAFDSEPLECRSSARSHRAPQERKSNLGFRVVRECSPTRRFGKLLIRLAQGDITRRKTKAIVNPTSRSMTLTGAVSRALLVAGGLEIQHELKSQPNPDFGGLLKTSAGRLQAQLIYHVVINEREALKHAHALLRNLLLQAGYDRIQALVMPLLGMALTGVEPAQALAMVLDGLVANSAVVERELAVDIVILDPQVFHLLMPVFQEHRPLAPPPI